MPIHCTKINAGRQNPTQGTSPIGLILGRMLRKGDGFSIRPPIINPVYRCRNEISTTFSRRPPGHRERPFISYLSCMFLRRKVRISPENRFVGISIRQDVPPSREYIHSKIGDLGKDCGLYVLPTRCWIRERRQPLSFGETLPRTPIDWDSWFCSPHPLESARRGIRLGRVDSVRHMN